IVRMDRSRQGTMTGLLRDDQRAARAALLDLNSWARAKEGSRAPARDGACVIGAAELGAARRAAAAARHERGSRAWNSWAGAMLDFKPEIGADPAMSQLWRDLATTDFAGTAFRRRCDFAEFLFPGPADFRGARFAVDAWFNGARFADVVDFSRSS